MPTIAAITQGKPASVLLKQADAEHKTGLERTAVSRLSGQTVATTLKLDEDRYLRLAEAGRPGPGRLKRRTLQDMIIEALDEWFEKRNL